MDYETWFDETGQVTVEAMYEADGVRWKRDRRAFVPGSGCRGLMSAVTDRDPDRFKAVLAGGCDLKLQPGVGSQALEHAIALGEVEPTRLLLDAGVDPNAGGKGAQEQARGRAVVSGRARSSASR